MPDILIPTEHQIDDFVHAALTSGALCPIETHSCSVEQDGLPFVVKWADALARKPRTAKPGRGTGFNPFEHPEPGLTLGDIAPAHRLLLNKFPVMKRHLLIVTRRFEPQERVLSADDLAALAPLIAANDGLGFYNGGAIAGASQAHKHLQWIPQCPPLAAHLPVFLERHPDRFAFRHACAALSPALWQGRAPGEILREIYAELIERTGLETNGETLGPYNLLLTREWMWLVPRRAERWREMSINALGFAGSLFVKRKDAVADLVAAGPMNVLREIAWPV